MKTMDGLVFNQAEFLALMSAVNASGLIGVDSNAIVPDDKVTHQKMVLSGLEQLKERGIVEEKDGVMLFPPDLVGMAAAMSEPQLVVQVTREEPEVGQRLFMMYQAFQFIVEFTLPAEGQFRMARIPSTPAMLQRIHFLLDVGDNDTQKVSFTVDQNAFFQSKAAIDEGKDELALSTLQNNGASAKEASLLVTVMKHLRLIGTITWLRTENGRVLDGRNLLILKTAGSCWALYQQKAGQSQLMVETVDRQAFLTIAYQLQVNLIQANKK